MGAVAQLAVDDSGAGFSPTPEELQFPRLHSSKPEGMGLGLAIASRIATSHGAHMAVEVSTLGGARVVVEFPLDESAQGA